MDQILRLAGYWEAGVIVLFVFFIVLDRVRHQRARDEGPDTRNKGDMQGPA